MPVSTPEPLWNSLIPPWLACLEEAWEAYCAGSLPIGAVVVDEHGNILTRGRNHRYDNAASHNQVSASRLAHAELNALVRLPEEENKRYYHWSLYSTTEPCPLCIGALYMSGVRHLHYASRDPWAGSVNLLGASAYTSRKAIRVFGPDRPDLEAVIVATGVVALLDGRIKLGDPVLEKQRSLFPVAVGFGEKLFEDQALQKMRDVRASVPEVYNQLAQQWAHYEAEQVERTGF